MRAPSLGTDDAAYSVVAVPPLEPSATVSDTPGWILAEFLRRNRQAAIAEWERAVRAIPAAALLNPVELRDHMPVLVDRLLELLEPHPSPPIDEIPDRHAIERLHEGFDLEQVAWEYSALRSTLLRLNEQEGSKLGATSILLLNDAIDRAVLRAISKFHHARVRMLEALNRIAQEGLLVEPEALDVLLHRLLRVILDTTESVDTAVLFLLEGERLVLRAAAGIEEELEGRFSLAVGEGFAGTIAKTRQPRFTHSAQTDPLVRNPVLRLTGVKALYGVPLVYGNEVVGVAKMGSRAASDFAPDDRQILLSTAERAAALIAQRRSACDREMLLHILGHDLRSPLSTILLGATSVVQGERLSPAALRNLQRVHNAWPASSPT